MVSDQLLEGAGVLGEASVSEWPLFFVPLADDVLSLELDDSVSDLYLVCLEVFCWSSSQLTWHREKTQLQSTSQRKH